MIQEDKDLLLKDICSRLPYDIKFPITVKNPITSEPIETIGTISNINRYGIVSFVWDYEGQEILVKDSLHIKDVKPYLFPMSLMTEEQEKEWNDLNFDPLDAVLEGKFNGREERLQLINKSMIDPVQWCYKNHFDVYGLIPKGLANDATGLNIY